ncbi:ABC transporter ATP-binding protein [Ramlibacter tataouinensis]|uniref:Candidate ABC type oligopeptide transport system, ATP-binding component with duplicated domains n=1 Tax=Ramlibacter tataouinensis (strain ATCC BAA-407 / DSM 14655 / LMG 21543 / TTB310) TaxID=365046 RepID=F5XXR2_RAMTT|nr:dipeptide ABC transporter ATP-binding protein [Ramlibacter tataouinensis]AEG93047.1 candidate ABC type oligopeptide transport system, ATP-binding component with duplicated domains [Ramlibacter tataouinensis TTB310]
MSGREEGLAPLLEVSNLRVAFGGKEVVHGVSFAIAPGEKLALVGESGSGKTVTALSLLRLAQGARLGGSARLLGSDPAAGRRDLLAMSERELLGVRGREIAMIFQEPMTALNPVYTVGDQIAEVLRLKQGLSARQAWDGAVEALAATGVPEPQRRARAFPHQLSGGQRQRAMIAMALACRPRLLLADEPTTALDVTLRQQILELLAQLQRQTGMAVLMITHDLNLVRKFADRVAVMENGHLVEHGAVQAVFGQPRHPYTRKLIDSRPERELQEGPPEGEPVMRAREVRVSYPVPLAGIRGWFRRGEFVAVHGAAFAIPPGRTLGVVGESGSGKSTLALAALGLVPHRGTLEVAGGHWQRGTAASRPLRRQIQVVFQDPFSSLSPRMTVEEIVGEGLLVHEPGLDLAQRRERVVRALGDVGLTEQLFPGLLARYPHEFSGGQRQRLAIARALIVEPRLLVLDEPTSALDVTIQKQVLRLLQRLQRERGLSYLLITHDIEVIHAMAHDVVVMKEGRIVEAGTAQQVLGQPQDPYTQALIAAAV